MGGIPHTPKIIANIPFVIASMSSEKTCLQGFSNDDIFGVIAFALVQIKAVGLR